jgi:hypothetical protein
MNQKLTTGPASAALVAAGIGSFTLAFMICATEAIKPFKAWANWYGPVGPLAGKTGMAIIVWAVAWAVLHFLWKDKEPDFKKAATIAFVLIGVGFLGTFPPIYDLFTAK